MQYETNEAGRQEILKQLRERLESRLEKARAAEVEAFAGHFYAMVPLEDLVNRRLDDFYGATLSVWHLIQNFDPATPKVRVFNPDFAEHGWQSPHTCVAVLHEDMPFLVDSVRIELNRRGLTVHAIHNAVLATERSRTHDLLQVASPRDVNAPSGRESLIAIEIDRHSSPEMLADIEQALEEVLRDVRIVVRDYEAMSERVRVAIAEVKAGRPEQIEQEDHEEAVVFLEWLLRDNFTFLGYDAYTIESGTDGDRLIREEGSELGVFGLDLPRYQERIRTELGIEESRFVLVPQLLSFAKSAHHARVHRPSYPDYISIDRYDERGRVIGEHRFLGLFTADVYNDSARNIPLLRRKLKAVMELAGFTPNGHNGKQLQQILEVYPRDDLFQSDIQELAHTALGILGIRERRRVRLFIRTDQSGRFYSCLVFVPRDVFSTDLRVRIQHLLCEELDATFGDFNTYLSESVLGRVQFILRFRNDAPREVNVKHLEAKVAQLARSWRDELHEALVEGFGEEQANRLMDRFRDAFSASYRDTFGARAAVFDLQQLAKLDAGEPLAMTLYRLAEGESSGVNLKLYHPDLPIPLSDVLPVMENLGLRVISERPYEIVTSGEHYWLHDFDLEHHAATEVNLQQMSEPFIEAFKRIWAGEADNDGFNRLVIAANLDWREVAMLRAYARYLKQIGFGMSQEYIATTLAHYSEITRELVTLFRLRFDPAQRPEEGELDACGERITRHLDGVASLNDDQLLRRFMEMIQATLRTNYYQRTAEGGFKDYIAYKLEPDQITGMPKPRPAYEIFVCSPRVEGVHLRGGKVARGGLRWSDRQEDFRTEVLGLVKAQQVKNAVIVPVGAKGGFVCKRLPEGGDREAIQHEGIACYKTFIRALLDITDNLVDGEVVPPKDVVRHDDDDVYMVVAADKGTATFSDIANEISVEYGHWLGDAFASGGANGYDHKKMGITARGAWESVKGHFRSLGLNTQEEEFNVVGIGDMGGDVFGNGMLLSDKIRLVGAFNHLHIFIDPTPDAAATFAERERLFRLPRSSWEDFDPNLISTGGGVFKRSAKSISITPQMQEVLGIEEDVLTPSDLIRALLRAPVDLLWNGGIGTYVKGSEESDAQVGDKANDSLRINGGELRCRVVGEGGNLGFTQRGRMEAAARGIRINTDFIDNAGGVNCSDHEVNIKILLDEVVKQGDMTDKQRNQLLADMTEEVARLVILDNYRQAQALDLSQLLACQGIGPYRRFINELEAAGQLDRELEFLPSNEELQERANGDQGMLLPELAVLISYAKSALKEDVLASDVPDDPYIRQHVERIFPKMLAERFPDEMYTHRLKREIVTTQVANDLVNHMGIVFVRRLVDSTGARPAAIARAYIVARDSFQLADLWERIEALDNQVPSQVQYAMMLDLMRLIRHTTRWFLRQHLELSPQEAIDCFAPHVAQLQQGIGELLRGEEHSLWERKRDDLLAAGVPEELAATVAASSSLYNALGIIQTARQAGAQPQRVAEVFFEVGSRLELPWMIQQVSNLEVRDNWQAQARETFRDDINRQQLALTLGVLKTGEEGEAGEGVDRWLADHASLHERWCGLIAEVRGGNQASFPLFAVAVRELVELAESNRDS